MLHCCYLYCVYTLIYCIYNRTYSYSVSRVVTYQSNDVSEENENNDGQPEIDRNYGNNIRIMNI